MWYLYFSQFVGAGCSPAALVLLESGTRFPVSLAPLLHTLSRAQPLCIAQPGLCVMCMHGSNQLVIPSLLLLPCLAQDVSSYCLGVLRDCKITMIVTRAKPCWASKATVPKRVSFTLQPKTRTEWNLPSLFFHSRENGVITN